MNNQELELEIEIENLEIEIDNQKNSLRRTDLRIKKIQFDAALQVEKQEEAKEKLQERIKILEDELEEKRNKLSEVS